MAVAVLGGFLLFLLVMAFGGMRSGSTGAGPAVEFLLTVLAGLVVASLFLHWDPLDAAVHFLMRRADRHTLPIGREVLASDPRPPILYLRSFVHDAKIAEQEEALGKVFDAIGPFVAIGKPGERLPPFGAARFYVADERWQEFVSEFLSKAAAVVIVAGSTPGLGWELEQCKKHVPPERLLLLLPKSTAEYEAFRRHADTAVGLALPTSGQLYRRSAWRRGKWIGIIAFDAAWQPRWLPFPDRGRVYASAPEHRIDALVDMFAETIAGVGPSLGIRARPPVKAPIMISALLLFDVLFTIGVLIFLAALFFS